MAEEKLKYYVIVEDKIEEFDNAKDTERCVKKNIELEPRVFYGKELAIGIRLGKEE
jgi:hypothetical protein